MYLSKYPSFFADIERYRMCELEAKVSTNPIGMSVKASAQNLGKCVSVLWSHEKELILLFDGLPDSYDNVDLLRILDDLEESEDARKGRSMSSSPLTSQNSVASQQSQAHRHRESLAAYLKRKNLQARCARSYRSVVAGEGKMLLGLVDHENGTDIIQLTGHSSETIPNQFHIQQITIWKDQEFMLLEQKDHKLFVMGSDWQVSAKFGSELLDGIELVGEHLEKQWTCNGLVEPTKICTDNHENIFVASATESTIDAISPSGKNEY